MSNPVCDLPCILFALSRESTFLRRRLRPLQRITGGPGRAWLGGPADRPVLVVETGIGAARTEKALAWLTANYRPRFIVSAGFSGALQEGLCVGDLVLASEVADLQGGRWPANWAGDAASSFRRDRLLGGTRIVGGTEEKKQLGRAHGAAAVDMETAAVARFCHRRGIPFGCARAISDDVHTSLSPRLVSLLSGGRVSPLRILWGLIVSPGLAKELCRLARDTRRAAERLAGALDQLIVVSAAPAD